MLKSIARLTPSRTRGKDKLDQNAKENAPENNKLPSVLAQNTKYPCQNCGDPCKQDEKGQLLACGQCLMCMYCSTDCQGHACASGQGHAFAMSKHWRASHNAECERLAQMRIAHQRAMQAKLALETNSTGGNEGGDGAGGCEKPNQLAVTLQVMSYGADHTNEKMLAATLNLSNLGLHFSNVDHQFHNCSNGGGRGGVSYGVTLLPIPLNLTNAQSEGTAASDETLPGIEASLRQTVPGDAATPRGSFAALDPVQSAKVAAAKAYIDQLICLKPPGKAKKVKAGGSALKPSNKDNIKTPCTMAQPCQAAGTNKDLGFSSPLGKKMFSSPNNWAPPTSPF